MAHFYYSQLMKNWNLLMYCLFEFYLVNNIRIIFDLPPAFTINNWVIEIYM